jgi:hypothetical protein
LKHSILINDYVVIGKRPGWLGFILFLDLHRIEQLVNRFIPSPAGKTRGFLGSLFLIAGSPPRVWDDPFVFKVHRLFDRNSNPRRLYSCRKNSTSNGALCATIMALLVNSLNECCFFIFVEYPGSLK